MLLCQHTEFRQAILAAEQHFKDRGLRAAVIEKDYYVTEALRCVAQLRGDKLIFKGGTSLSKGWGLIDRFSEDVDLFLDPAKFTLSLGTNAINRELKSLRDCVHEHPQLTHLPGESQTIGGSARSDRFSYPQLFSGPEEVAPRVLLEVGTASGSEPTQVVQISSFLGDFLRGTGSSLGTDDEVPFPFRLLHFRRTFVEKLFAIHGKVEKFKRDRIPLGSYARHYYDLARLTERAEVMAMLKSAEYETIRVDYDRVSRAGFSRDYIPPEGMRFTNSDALFPEGELAAVLAAEYDTQCKQLCFGPYPPWEEVIARFARLRADL